MRTGTLSQFASILTMLWIGAKIPAAEPKFAYHFIDPSLPVRDKLVGDFGLTAFVDLACGGKRLGPVRFRTDVSP